MCVPNTASSSPALTIDMHYRMYEYCVPQFEEFMVPILDAMLEEQKRDGTRWTPSKMIHRLGKEINDPRCVLTV